MIITLKQAPVAVSLLLALGCVDEMVVGDGGNQGGGGQGHVPASGGSSTAKAGSDAGGAGAGLNSGGKGAVITGGSGTNPAAGSNAQAGAQAGEGGAASGPQICGDGVRQGDEDCDDGNGLNQDGCSTTCAVEDGFVCDQGDGAACNRSCAGMTGKECQGGDCCASLPVPGGTITYKDRQVVVPSFRLDKYEVTVGRFWAFLDDLDAWQAAGNPAAGAGAHPDVPLSGWRPQWLSQDLGGLADGLKPGICFDPDLAQGSYAGEPTCPITGAELLATNRVPWHIAFAFCIWDGGRLPADAEWFYAAYRGEEQTTYAWGNTPTDKQMFASLPPPAFPYPYDPVADSFWKYVSIPVGSYPAAVGRFGQQDLLDGLWEFTRDVDVRDSSATGLMELTGDDDLNNNHPQRGGSWEIPGMPNADRELTMIQGVNFGSGTVGFRCARNP